MFNIFNKPSTYVIKSWEATDEPNEDGIYVNIKGRKGGLIAFILSFIGIDPIVSLIVDRENIRFKETSLSGFNATVTSISKVCSGSFGYSKPLWLLIVTLLIGLSIFDVVGGGSGYFFGTIVILYGLYSYFFDKTTKLGVTYLDGGYSGFAFKRSLIEGQNIDAAAAERIIAIIEMIMFGRDKPRIVVDEISPEVKSEGFDFGAKAQEKIQVLKEKARDASEQVATSAAANLAAKKSSDKKFCPSCGETITIEDKFCGGCGHKTNALSH